MSDYFATVFGAGICGTAIVGILAEKGEKVLLVDPFVSEQAPGAPAGLVNPATGPRAKLCWRGKQCYETLRSNIDKLITYSGRDDLISESGVVRPALTGKLADNFKKALDKYDWPEGWIRWIEEEEITELNPDIGPNYGGLYLEVGFTVFVDKYLNTYRRFLRDQRVDCRYENAEYQAVVGKNTFNIQLRDSECTSDHVIIAAGHQTSTFNDWSHLPLEGVKGQIVRFEADQKLVWDHAVSAGGYCMRRGKRDIIVGATYEHHFEDLDTTEKAYDRIEQKLNTMLPDVARSATKRDQLAGVRVTTPNRLPVIGRHHKFENLCIYSGMNSKGLLFSHYVAKFLAEHLVSGSKIPGELDVNRFN